MKKILLNQFGGLDVLKISEVPIPKLEDNNQVLIKISYAGINPIDYKIRNGSSFVAKQLEKNMPCGLGFEVSGKIVEVRDKSQLHLIDTQACGLVGFPKEPNGYAEYTVAEIPDITSIPEKVPSSLASVLPIAGLTAWQALDLFGQDLNGVRLIIHAGAGGVGHLAIQLAKLRGAYVIATASPKNHDFLYQLGADKCIDYHMVNYLDECGIVNGVLDLVGGQTGLDSIAALSEKGLLVTVPSGTRDDIILKAQAAGIKTKGILVESNTQQLDQLLNLIAQKKILPHIAKIYSLNEVQEAHRQLEAGGFIGKLCLEL